MVAARLKSEQNRQVLQRAIRDWDQSGRVDLPHHIVVIRAPWICGTGKWSVTLGEQLGCGFDGSGLGYDHFTGDGDTPEEARAAAIDDMIARGGRPRAALPSHKGAE